VFWEREGRVKALAFGAAYHVREDGRQFPAFPLGGWVLPADDDAAGGNAEAEPPALLVLSFMHCKDGAREGVLPPDRYAEAKCRLDEAGDGPLEI